ncbi:MAG: Kazal-type serine protease inhibitor domain-containing protein [Parvularculaceae bacterium]
MAIAFTLSAVLLAATLLWGGAAIKLRQTFDSEDDANPVAIVANIDSEFAEQTRNGEQRKKCPLRWEPVCGADGVIYGNSCVAGNKVSYYIHPPAHVALGETCDPNSLKWTRIEPPVDSRD